MAQIPGIFNAAQYFGNSSPKKGQQESFWDQPSNSVNHLSGPVEFQRPFEGNSAATVDPFMTSVQNEFDGWDEWPTELEDDFFGNDSSHQNHVGPNTYFDPGSTPNDNTGYNDSQLVVPDHNQYQEDLSESSNSSSVDSSPRGMDPELNNAWVEEETTPYAFSKYPPAMVPSGQTPQTAASQGSGADFFDQYLNGETNMQQPDMGEENSTSSGRSYASVCQAGLPVPPFQDSQDYFQEQLVPPTSEAAGAPELLDPQENELGAETWSREPELGTWSPVFNHEDNSFASNQQHVPQSTVPQIDELTWTNTSTFEPGVGFGATAQQEVLHSSTFDSGENESNPLSEVPSSSTFEPGKVQELLPAASSQMQSFDDDRSILAQMYSGDDDDGSFLPQMYSQNTYVPGYSYHETHDDRNSAPLFNNDNNGFVDNQEGVSEHSVRNTDESTWAVNSSSSPFYSGVGFEAPTQEVPLSVSQVELFANSSKKEVENSQLLPHDAAVTNSQPDFFAGNEGHYSEGTNVPQFHQPKEVPPLFGGDAVNEDPFVMESRQEDSFPEETPVSHQIPAEDMSELLGNLQQGAVPASSQNGDDMLPRSDLEPPLQEQTEEFLSSLAPPAFPPAIPHLQQDGPLQNMAQNVPADHNAHVKLPYDEKPLADSLDQESSMDSPSGTFKPMQPPLLGQVPFEESPSGLFMPGSAGQVRPPMLPDMESSLSDADQPRQQESVPEVTSEPSGVQQSLADEPNSPRDAIQAAYLQKQLAGKAPASSPRTSLWMNSTASLTAPCVLAPAAFAAPVAPLTAPSVLFPASVATVEPSDLRENDQAPPAPPLTAPGVLAPAAIATVESLELRRNDQAPTTPAVTAPKVLPPAAVATVESSGLRANDQLPPTAPVTTSHVLPPAAVATVESSGPSENNQTPPAASLSAPSMLTTGTAAAVEPYEVYNTGQASSAALYNSHQASPAATLAAPSLNAPVVFAAVSEQSELRGNNQTPPVAPLAAPRVLAPAAVVAVESSKLHNVDQVPLTAPVATPHVQAAAAVATVEPSGLRENVQAPPASQKEQRTESSSAPPKTAPVQMSLASLLQGGKGRPKKKTSETPASSAQTDVGSSQGANPPPQETLPPNTFVPGSGIPPSNTVQEPPNNSDQHMDNQSFDSVDRTSQGHRTPYESDYDDPYSRDNSRSRDDPYYDNNRRDPYYEQDRRNPYNEQDRREYDRRDYDRRDYDRRDYDRRDYDRRDYDRRDRGEIDRRESDYGKRDYDSREYDRRDVGRRDYDRRESYDRRDPYYGYGSPRQGRKDYDERRTSREDLYRGHDQGYAHSYHSGRSTPSSDRNSPAYDYSSSSYASHQYGYPASYADSQSMYQYLTMLYYYYPQHYEQYCAQQGYYNMGYTPEQMAQFYGGMPYPAGYDGSQPEQAAEAEVQESEPARLTPPLYRVQHPLVRFSGGRLISLITSEDEEEQPKCVIASVQMVFSVEEMEAIKAFPGPLSSMYSSRTEVISYCEQRSAITDMSADGLVKSLVWKILANLIKHNGAFVPSDLAELIMENWRSCNTSDQNEFLSAESGPLSSENEKSKHLRIFREMLLAGATKDALEYTMRYGLWGHAMMLASKMDKKVQNEVTNRFMKTMTDFDPIRTVYDHLSGRQPVALMTPDDWQRNLAAMVANPPRQHPQTNRRNMICLGDTLMANDQVWAAHLCFILAGERFGYPSDEKTKMALIGIDHRKKMISEQNIPLENLQMMEVLEYAVSLNNEEHFIPVLQAYKYLHANKLAEAGFTDEALHYADLIGGVLIKHPHHLNLRLAKNVRELTDRLNPDAQDAAAAEMTEMLDKLLQAKDSSQISSSVTESEGEVEDPLAESSASFFSGYDPVNTPKHQVEKTEDIHHQDSWSEPALSGPAVSQDTIGDLRQDSQFGGMDTQDTQPALSPAQQLPPVEQLPPSTGLQPSAPWTEPPPAVDSTPQPPFFIPGPPGTQQLPGQMESEQQPAAMEEQPFYNQQPAWNDIQQPAWNEDQQPAWNDTRQLSWSEEARHEEPKKVEPPAPKEPEPPAKEEPKPKPTEKAKKKGITSSQGGWFSGLSGIIQKVIPRGPNEMILPDDSKKSIYWDEDLKKWVNTEEDEQEKAPPPPPPSDMQLGGGMPPPMPPPMPLGHGTPVNGGNGLKGVGGRAAASPFGAPHMPPSPGSPGMPPGMATPPVPSKFSRKAHGGRRHAKKYVDVLNPSGQSSSNATLPSSLLPMMPGTEFKGSFFVPSPVNTDTPDQRTDEQALDQPPAIGNPSSRPSSRNEEEDGGDQQSMHSRSSSASLTSAEVRSYMMPQDPDPPPQEMNATPPLMFNPMAFSQPKAQASPRKSRYPGIRKQ